jgi:hypothetical protein
MHSIPAASGAHSVDAFAASLLPILRRLRRPYSSSLCHPRKKQRQYYSGKKKRHAQKAQVVIAHKTREIICVATGKGCEHDFKLFKRSKLTIQAEIECSADRGYQGIQKLHPKSQTPKKKPRRGALNKQEKQQNRALASRRVVGEHVLGKLKVFRILGEKYRNRRKRFGLRLNLMASLYNLDLKLPRGHLQEV